MKGTSRGEEADIHLQMQRQSRKEFFLRIISNLPYSVIVSECRAQTRHWGCLAIDRRVCTHIVPRYSPAVWPASVHPGSSICPHACFLVLENDKSKCSVWRWRSSRHACPTSLYSEVPRQDRIILWSSSTHMPSMVDACTAFCLSLESNVYSVQSASRPSTIKQALS